MSAVCSGLAFSISDIDPPSVVDGTMLSIRATAAARIGNASGSG